MKYTSVVKLGSSNAAAVMAIKDRLNKLIGTTLDVKNGTFGASTESAVKKFQKSRNLLDDGIVGQITWNKLFAEEVAPLPVQANTLSARAIEIAKTQLNVREATGRNDGAAVESYLRSVNLGKGYAWCAAFVYWCFNQAAKDLNVPNPLAATAGVMHHWNNVAAKYKVVSQPKAGDIFIMDFGKGKGHTGIVTEVKGNKIYTIEGNTGADPTTAASDRDGDGVYQRSRLISKIKGFIRYN